MGLLRKLTKALLWLTLGILLLVLSLYGLLVAINWQDQAPSNAALTLEASLQHTTHIDATDNGYQYLLKHGNQRHLTVSTDLQTLFRQCEQGDCLQVVTAAHDQVPTLIGQHQALLDFYRQLQQFSYWQEPVPAQPDNLPSYQPLLNAQRLQLLLAWQALQQDDLATARQLLDDDLKFWRLVIANNQLLLSAMISQTAVQRHFAFGQMMMQSISVEQQAALLPEGWLVPFREAELNAKRVYAGEWLFGTNIMHEMWQQEFTSTGSTRMEHLMMRALNPLFLPQASANDYAELLLACLSHQGQQAIAWYHWFYNPLGKLLNHSSNLNCHNFNWQQSEQQRRHLIETYTR
ncbi:hypothetical protein QWY20_11550 [Alkalimonas sp. MEB108]|uniref:Uncharacterized protein n=1 Tax=Alkalimonas cellulosilytica TaxID=3058395 RepID=A0ABU7J6P5_9GAMM|nr:hypothetical protein [Alkalimonas sp. MEB108]MEE2002089.1 hypothetical protein [Alkalimonas sp. MEB108]